MMIIPILQMKKLKQRRVRYPRRDRAGIQTRAVQLQPLSSNIVSTVRFTWHLEGARCVQ